MNPNWGDRRLPERFWNKVAPCPMSGCWLWTTTLNIAGYGRFHLNGRLRLAHRVAYEVFVCAIPDGLVLDHRVCSTKCCVNPLHLEPVTHAENIRRAPVVRARAARTHCIRGHEYSGDNLYVTTRQRVCKECSNMTHRLAYAARMASK